MANINRPSALQKVVQSAKNYADGLAVTLNASITEQKQSLTKISSDSVKIIDGISMYQHGSFEQGNFASNGLSDNPNVVRSNDFISNGFTIFNPNKLKVAVIACKTNGTFYSYVSVGTEKSGNYFTDKSASVNYSNDYIYRVKAIIDGNTPLTPEKANLTVYKHGTVDNSWFGKNVLFIGDSLTASKKYQNTVASMLGINIYNHCKGGQNLKAMVDGESGAGEYDNTTAVEGTLYALSVDDVKGKDLIVFYSGYNDRSKLVGTLGDLYNTDGTGQNTISGMMQYCINRIYEVLNSANNKTCKLLIVTVDCVGKYPYIDVDGYGEYPSGSGQTMEDIANMQKAVANANAIPCVDLWHNSGINRNTWSVFGKEANAYYEDTTGRTGTYPHNGDQLHKSNEGYKRIGECIVGGIISAYGK